MTQRHVEFTRLRQILLSTAEKPNLQALKRLVRNWRHPGSPGQDAINRSLIRAVDELQQRMDALIRI